MCNDGDWATVMAAAANGSEPKVYSIGVSYMLQGDSNVSNSNPAATDPKSSDAWVQEGPHLMIFAPK